MVCKLCGKPNVLKYSHIIPSSFHKDIKDNGKNLKVITPPSNGIKKNQKDLAEYMLCGDCEISMGDSEKIAIPALKKISNGLTGYIDASVTTEIERFIRSVFWRASVSNICKYRLSDSKNEILQKYLLGEITLDSEIFSTQVSILTPVVELKKGNGGLIIEPWSDFDVYGIVDHFVVGGITCSMIWSNSNIRNNEANILTHNKKYFVKKSSKNINLKVNDFLTKFRREGLEDKYQYLL